MGVPGRLTLAERSALLALRTVPVQSLAGEQRNPPLTLHHNGLPEELVGY
ncbi:hypothetical protein [Streptomyces puniciscabiei]